METQVRKLILKGIRPALFLARNKRLSITWDSLYFSENITDQVKAEEEMWKMEEIS